MTSQVHFENKLPMQRRKKALIGFAIIALISVATITIFFLLPEPIKEEKDSSDDHPDFPTIYLTCNDDLDNENYSNCVFELDSSESSERIDPLNAEIKIRGETSATYPKKGYRLQLSKGEPLLGMRDDADWQLFASYYDYTRLKVKLSFNLWRNLLPENPTAILPSSRYVLLYLNGNFQGLYLLAEKNDRKLLRFDEEPISPPFNESSLIFQAKDPSNFSYYYPENWEQDYPDNNLIMDEIMTKLITFMNNTTNSTFFNPMNGIYSKFDEVNLIDFFLYNFFILHIDFWDKNYFIARNTHPNKFFLVPWDFDLSFGQNASDPILAYDEDPEAEIHEKNLLYDRLLKNDTFRQNCSARWKELRSPDSNVWSNESIFRILSRIYSECRIYLQVDLNIWNPPYNSEVYVNQLKEWITDRLEFCDYHFKYDFF